MSVCKGCGKEAYKTKTVSLRDEHGALVLDENKQTIEIQTCNNCSSIASAGFRDAKGNIISFPDSLCGKYSYATGQVHTSKRDFAEHCRKEGLYQRG